MILADREIEFDDYKDEPSETDLRSIIKKCANHYLEFRYAFELAEDADIKMLFLQQRDLRAIGNILEILIGELIRSSDGGGSVTYRVPEGLARKMAAERA